MIEIKNTNEIVEELAEMLMAFSKEMNQIETDVYLYIDNNGIGTLKLYENPGGNSWIDDDHFIIYRDKPHFKNEDLDWYDSEESMAEWLDMTVEELKKKTAKYLYEELDGWEDISREEIEKYITDHTTLSEKLYHIYCDEGVDGCANQYLEAAKIIFEEWYKIV